MLQTQSRNFIDKGFISLIFLTELGATQLKSQSQSCITTGAQAPSVAQDKSKSESCFDRRQVDHSVLESRPDVITVRQLRICSYGAPSLKRDKCLVYNSCWSTTAQSISGPSPAGLITKILLSQIRDSPNLKGKFLVFTSLRNSVAQFYAMAMAPPPFRRLLRFEGL
jgi:hypothetical protein